MNSNKRIHNTSDTEQTSRKSQKITERNGTRDGAFYTSMWLIELVNLWARAYLINNGIDVDNVLILSPQAGDGRMVRLYKHSRAYDINPTHKDVIKYDYLKLNINEISEGYDNVIILENPNFNNDSGKHDHFVEFFNWAALYKKVSHIMTIGPDRFRSHTCMCELSTDFALKKWYIISSTGEEYEKASGKTATIPTSFQIWKRTDIPRIQQTREINILKHTNGTSPMCWVKRRPKKNQERVTLSRPPSGKNTIYPVYSLLPEQQTLDIVRRATNNINPDAFKNYSFVAGNIQNYINEVLDMLSI